MKSLKKILWIYIRFVQKILITLFLTITYFTAIPFSWLYLLIFKPRHILYKFKIKNSYWIPLQFMQNNISEFKEQS